MPDKDKIYVVKVVVTVELSFDTWKEAFLASMDTSYISEEIADALKDGSYEVAPITASTIEVVTA